MKPRQTWNKTPVLKIVPELCELCSKDGSTGGIVAEPGTQAGQVDLVIEQVIHCVFDGAG